MLLLARLLVGIFLVFLIPALCVDDDMRTFYSHWWFNLPSFSPSRFWLPGQFYVYGLVDGLSDDMLVVPRYLTLLLHTATAAVVLWLGPGSRRARLLAAGILLFSPLALVLGTVPLSETLFALLASSAVLSLERWAIGGRHLYMIAGAALFIAASCVRYEGWALLPVLPLVASLFRRGEGRRVFAMKAICAFALAAFPVAWMAWWHAGEGDALGFLDNIATDSFGAGSLLAGLRDPRAWSIPVLAALGLAAVACRFVGALRRREIGRAVPELAALWMVALLAWALAASNVPSQYPLRMLYPLTVLSAVPLARALDARLLGARAKIAMISVFGVLPLLGALYVSSVSEGYHASSRLAGRRLAELAETGRIAEGERVIVEKRLPEAYGVVVHSNRFETVRINDMGSWAPSDYLGCVPTGVPAEVGASRLSVVWSAPQSAYLEALGWREAARDGPWTLFARPAGAPPLGTCPTAPRERSAASVTGGD